MSDREIFEIVRSKLIEIVERTDLVVTDATNAKDIPEWDSLLHIQLIFELEKSFKIRFTAMEIGRFENVGQLCNGIKMKI